MSLQKKNITLALAIVSFIFYFLGFCKLLDSSTVEVMPIIQICLGLTATIISIIFFFKGNMDAKKILISLSFLSASLICGNIVNLTDWTFVRVGYILVFLIPLILFAISFTNKKAEQVVGISFIVMCVFCTYLSVAIGDFIYASAAALFIAFSMKLFNNKEE